MYQLNFELQEGDVFLYHGKKIFSKLIRKFDGTEVNHASLYIGNNQVIEATSGVTQNNIESSIRNSNYIKVYRPNDNIPDINPVLDVAKNFHLSPNRYGFEQILLLAFILLIKKAMPNRVFRWISKVVLEKTAAILLKFTENGKQVLICSELVFKSYEEPYPGILNINNWNTVKSSNNLPGNIYPESLYALFSNPSAKISANNKSTINAQEKVLQMAHNNQIEDIINSLDIELEQSLEYLENEEDNINVPDVNISEVESAFELFANQINRQLNISENLDEAIYKKDKSLTVNNLNRVIADFVTPGDLYRTSALRYIGKISNN